MSEPVLSLKTTHPQLIPPRTWTVVRFPYDGESYDALGMHEPIQTFDDYEVRDWQRDDRSGLAWPHHAGWVRLYAMVQWEPASRIGGYRSLHDQFARDPLGLTTGLDTTATDQRPPTDGMQSFCKAWGLFANPMTPLALRVWHNDRRPRRVTLAEFKVEYRV